MVSVTESKLVLLSVQQANKWRDVGARNLTSTWMGGRLGIPGTVGFFFWGFPGGSDSKVSAYNAGDQGSIPGSGRPPREKNGYPFQYSCLENSMERGAWWAIVHGVTESDKIGRASCRERV